MPVLNVLKMDVDRFEQRLETQLWNAKENNPSFALTIIIIIMKKMGGDTIYKKVIINQTKSAGSVC